MTRPVDRSGEAGETALAGSTVGESDGALQAQATSIPYLAVGERQAIADFAPCPTCHQYSHSIGEGEIAKAFNHFQSMVAHPVRGHPMGYAFEERTRDAAQVLVSAILSLDSPSLGEGWIALTADRVLYVDQGKETILCDRLPSPITLVIKNPARADGAYLLSAETGELQLPLADRGGVSATPTINAPVAAQETWTMDAARELHAGMTQAARDCAGSRGAPQSEVREAGSMFLYRAILSLTKTATHADMRGAAAQFPGSAVESLEAIVELAKHADGGGPDGIKSLRAMIDRMASLARTVLQGNHP